MLDADAVAMVTAMDPAIFVVETSTTLNDRRSLLRIQAMMRTARPYTFLEIGSYRGGSLVPHLIDPRCTDVVSIDKRPDLQPDERAMKFSYQGITTALMVETLRPHVPQSGLAKLRTFDADAAHIAADAIGCKLDLAFIDGEHTNVATFSDFMSILPSLSPDAVVVFHDANLISDAIRNIERFLAYRGIDHCRFYLPDFVAAIALGGMIAPAVAALALIAHDPAAFVTWSRQRLHEQIAAAVAEGRHLA